MWCCLCACVLPYTITYSNIHYHCIYAYVGQVETNDTILELKVHLQPALTCSEFIVSCLGKHYTFSVVVEVHPCI